MKRIVLLMEAIADKIERSAVEHSMQCAIAEVIGSSQTTDIEFRRVERTNPLLAIRKGFQEYRIALELSPDLVVTNSKTPYDAMFRSLGIPFLALDEELSEDAKGGIRKTLEDSSWTYGRFATGAIDSIANAEKITILGEGASRTERDEGLVIGLSPFQMFTDPAPDFFVVGEHPYVAPLYTENNSVIANRWWDSLDLGGKQSLPFEMDIEEWDGITALEDAPEVIDHLADEDVELSTSFVIEHKPLSQFWQKGIEIRNLTRSVIGQRCPNVVWSPYPEIVVEDQRFRSHLLMLVSAIRDINQDAEITYRWKRTGLEVPTQVVMENTILTSHFGPAEVVEDLGEHVGSPLPIYVEVQNLDLDLTRCASEIALWLYTQREMYLDETIVKANNDLQAFMMAQGFSDEPLPSQEPKFKIVLRPILHYPA